MKYEIYTDGACSGNPGPGASTFVILRDGEEFCRGTQPYPETTNNKAEMLAAMLAMLKIPYDPHNEITIYTDSKYLIGGMTEWREGWEKKGYRNVKNLPIWRRLWSVCRYKNVSWVHVRAHSGVEWNEVVDGMAKSAVPK